MVKRVVEQQEAIQVVLASDQKTSHLISTWQDFNAMDSILAALGPLGELTDALSAEKLVTIFSSLPTSQPPEPRDPQRKGY